MNELHQKSWMDRCEKLVMVLLCVLMADCALGGAGRIITVGPLGFRMILVGLVMIAGIPVMIRDFKKLIGSKTLWVFAGFAIWLILQTIRGIAGGNDMGILIADLKGFSYFVVMLPAICVLNSRARIRMLMKTMLWASAVLAVITLIATCLYKWNYELFMWLRLWDYEEQWLQLSMIIERKVPRLFFKSTNYFLAGCAFSVFFYVTQKGEKLWKYPALTGLFLFALLMSYTRAVYLAACIAAVVLVLVFQFCGDRKSGIRMWKHLGVAVLVFIVITGGLSAMMDTNYMEHGIRRVVATFEDEEASASVPEVPVKTAAPQTAQVVRLSNVTFSPEELEQEENYAEAMTHDSDEIRETTLEEMNSYIRSAPLFGHGLGKAITCRRDGLSEYHYHNLLVKTGVVGLVLYLMPVLWMVAELMKKKTSKPDKLILGSWLAVLLGFLGFSYYNPYMNASLGILFYCCTLDVFVNLKKQTEF